MPRKPKNPGRFKFVLYVALLFTGAVFVRFVLARQAKPDTPASAESIAAPPGMKQVQAEELYNSYVSNESAANDRFKGETIRVTGKIITMDASGDDPYIVLCGKEPYSALGVQCIFDDKEAVARLNKLQTVTIEGRVRGRTIHVMMKDCVVR